MQEYSRNAILNLKKEKTQVNNNYSTINRSQLENLWQKLNEAADNAVQNIGAQI